MTSRRLPGRYVRAFTGSIMIVGSVLTYLLGRGRAVSWQDVAIHVALIVGGLLMVDPAIGDELRDMIKAWRGGKE